MRCPNCGANILFDSKSQVYKCQYCGSTYTVNEFGGPSFDDQMTSKSRRTSTIIAISVAIVIFVMGLVAFLIMIYSSPN